MPIDLTKLTPTVSWHPENWDAYTLHWLHSDEGGHDLTFLQLARAAFDVMMRRGWGVENRGGWYATSKYGDRAVGGTDLYPDPFTALVEADAWYKQNVEAAPEAK